MCLICQTPLDKSSIPWISFALTQSSAVVRGNALFHPVNPLSIRPPIVRAVCSSTPEWSPHVHLERHVSDRALLAFLRASFASHRFNANKQRPSDCARLPTRVHEELREDLSHRTDLTNSRPPSLCFVSAQVVGGLRHLRTAHYTFNKIDAPCASPLRR
jgi:hypothetical protein